MNLKKYTQKDRYGNMFSYEFDVPSMQEIPQPDPEIFKPKGTDTVPAMLTPGENVVNAEASRLPGVQPMLDKLNDKGRAIQKEQGGPIPSYNSRGDKVDYYGNNYGQSTINAEINTLKGMGLSDAQIIQALMNNLNMSQGEAQSALMPTYKQEGGVITEDMMPSVLDAIRKVESGGDVNAVSEVGAAGPYQIMKATALKPGYGVEAISGADRFNEVKSRAFAKQYLQGIMKAHPEFTKDEVITAYHSGVGNVLKAKGGVEELGTRGKRYAGKVNTAMGIPKIIEYDATPQEAGFMSAQASTMSDREKKDAELLKGITQERDIDDRNFFTKLFSDAPPAEDPVLPMDESENALGVIPDFKSKFPQMVNTLFKAPPKTVESIVDDDPSGAEITANSAAKLIEEMEASEGYAEEEGKLTLDKADTEWAKKNLTGKYEGDFSQYLINKGKEYGGIALDKSIEYFKNTFSNMFDGEELARMALMYTGSRALGYDHLSSIKYGMKNYIKRVDNEIAQRKKNVASAAWIKEYTPESMALYLKSGDMSDLAKKGATLKKPSGSVYVVGEGEVPTFTMSDGTETAFHKGQYKPFTHKDLIGRVDKMNNDVYGDVAVSKRFAEYAKEQIKKANADAGLKAGRKDDDTYDTMFRENANSIGTRANAVYREVLRSNFISIKQAPRYEMAIQRGIDAYLRDVALAKKNNRTAPKSVEAYIREQVFVPLSGVGGDQVGKTSTQHITEINREVKRGIPGAPDSQEYLEEYKRRWAKKTVAWNQLRLTNPKQYQKIKDGVDRRNNIWLKEQPDKTTIIKNWDPFTYWVSITPESEIDRLIDTA